MQPNQVNGWREVLERLFAGFKIEYGVMPEWLVNPDTHRRLKLDYLMPEVGVAVRFIGVDGGVRKRRKSDEEVAMDAAREDNREEVCREHGIVLLSIDPDGDPREALRHVETGLARATARLAMGKMPQVQKQRLMPLLSTARQRTGDFSQRLTSPEAVLGYAELWWDRQAALAANAQPTPVSRPAFQYRTGMAVSHERFGPGQVTAVQPDGKDIAVTVRFADASERTFYAGVVGDKLKPR
ncbi:MAG TPA: hypothetical protein VGA61_06030 [Anaerolineae bacterium]